MHYKLYYPSLYLGAHDLNGKDAVLTMRRLVIEEIETERGTEKRAVLYFVETAKKAEREKTKEKRLVLNKTNASTIAAMYGAEVNDWHGKRITLYAANVVAFGKEQEAIRVRPTPPATNPAPNEPETK